MFKILTQEETEQLRAELLSQLPESAKMYNNISSHLNDLLTGFEVVVDQWPKWTSIILRPNCLELVPLYFKNYHICHTRSVKDFKFFIQRPGVIDWSKPAIFTGIPYDAVSVIQDKSRREHGQVTSVENRFMYCWTQKELPEPEKLNGELQWTSLSVEDAGSICSHWKHYRKNDGLLQYYQKVLKNFESAAVVNKDGKLIAYICMQFNGSMANLYVNPEYRMQNLGVALLKELTRKLLTKGLTAYGFVKTEDSAFISTCQKIGFSWVPQGSTSWIHYKPLSLMVSKSQPQQHETCKESEKKDIKKTVFLNAMPLSCNECLIYNQDRVETTNGNGAECIHVIGS